MSQDRIQGFVVGSNRCGKEWVVRVKDENSIINAKKLTVSSVKFGTKLAPGQDVSFLTNEDGNLAIDVQVMPRVEAPTAARKPL